jgi:hypothetical protein
VEEMEPHQHRGRAYNWTDVSFTPLPIGWVNVFKREDASHYAEPCPGVLTREIRTRRATIPNSCSMSRKFVRRHFG